MSRSLTDLHIFQRGEGRKEGEGFLERKKRLCGQGIVVNKAESRPR